MSGRASGWTDRQMLEVLDLVQRQKLTARQAGEQFGVTKSAILGLIHRVEKDLALIPVTATKPANQDGAMPPRWWDVAPQMRRQR